MKQLKKSRKEINLVLGKMLDFHYSYLMLCRDPNFPRSGKTPEVAAKEHVLRCFDDFEDFLTGELDNIIIENKKKK